MGLTVSFGRFKTKRVLYTTKRAETVMLLYSFFKKHTGYVRTRDIKTEVHVSNSMLFFLAYQGYMTIRPKFCRYTDQTGKQRFAQVYTWKANLDRFAQFAKEAKISVEKHEKFKQEMKELEEASVEDILKKQEEFEADENEDTADDN